MGAEPYWYCVRYQRDIGNALEQLRKREFVAGRYNPVIPFPSTLSPIGPHSLAPGAQHSSIDGARKAAGGDGTRSILDLDHVSDSPDFYAVTPLDDAVLLSLYGTTRPTRQMVEQNMEFFEDLERGHGLYIVLYRDDKPDELFFAGYSFD